MLSDRCRAFREEYERGRGDAHPRECPACAAWVDAVSRLRDAGVDVPVPAGLALRLRGICPAVPRSAEGPGAHRGDGATLAPLPQIPIPEQLRERLRSIPAGRGDASLPAWVFRPRDLLAASCLLALLLTVAVGTPPPETLKTAASVSRDVATRVQEAGVVGTRTLVGAGQALSRGIETLNRSMGSLMGRLGPRRKDTAGPAAGKAPPAKGHPKEDKERSHGKRPEPRHGAPRG